MPAGHAFDLVMLDLPREPGEAAQIIEQIARQQIAPAIAFMSSGHRRGIEAACAMASAHGLLVCEPLLKPIQPDHVTAMLETPLRLASGKPGAALVSQIIPDMRQASYVFQSKHGLRSGAVTGYETLLRMPGVDAVDRWFAGLDYGSAFAMTVAAGQAAFGLSARLGGAGQSSTVAFHCPPEIFADARFLAELTQLSVAARRKGNEKNHVALELTAPKDDAELSEIASIAFRYVLAGFELHINDFAMNPGSLQQAMRLPINEAKIDRSFFRDLLREDPILMSEIVSLFRLRGIRSTVGRIEADEEVRLASQSGADCGQGYYWSRPIQDVQL